MLNYAGNVRIENIHAIQIQPAIFSGCAAKFASDQVITDREELMLHFIGVLLNRSELEKSTGTNDLEQIIISLWHAHKQNIGAYLHGSFVIMIFDKKNNIFFLSNDRLSKCHLYYANLNSRLYFSSSFFQLVDDIKNFSFSFSFHIDTLALTSLIVKGQMIDNLTLSEDIKYLMRDEFIYIQDNNFQIGKLELPHYPDIVNENQIVEEIHERFSSSLRSQLAKNEENGYKHLISLSAGMDSRSVALYAASLGYSHFTSFTYAESSSMDNTIAARIAKDLKADHMFFQLDCPNFLLEFESICRLNECQQAYYGSTGAYPLMQLLDTTQYGIVHTGLLGGELMSDIFVEPAYTDIGSHHLEKEFGNFRYASNDDRERFHAILGKYSNMEDYLLMNHTRACQNFSDVVKERVESLSPFMHEEFYYFIHSLSPAMRFERNIYRKWMMKYVPNDYPTTYYKNKITGSPLMRMFQRAVGKIERQLYGKSRFEMNPFDYWFQTYPSLTQSIDMIVDQKINQLSSVTEMDQIQKYFQDNNAGPRRRMNILTALYALGTFFL